MWFLYVLVHVFLMSVVNYIDEYLTTNNKVDKGSDIHTKIGGLLLISTLMNFVGAFVVWVSVRNIGLPELSLVLSLLSAIPMVAMFASYFYLLTKYPVYQVAPLFLMSSIWLLFIELLFGGSASAIDIIGIATLLTGAYFLDAGTFRWQIPSKLLMAMIPATSAWAIALFLVRKASENGSAVAVSFWQYVGIACLGVILLLTVKKYRNGFLYRIKSQGKNFLGFSLINESVAQASFVFGNLAVAAAPLATYITAMSGVQSIFLLLLFIVLPINKHRTKITRLHVVSILLIVLGVFLIEFIQ